jgi:hypothetical protein
MLDEELKAEMQKDIPTELPHTCSFLCNQSGYYRVERPDLEKPALIRKQA